MTFSFNSSLSSDTDRVRARIGQTVEAGNLIENETISTYLSDTGDVDQASIKAVEFILARLAANYDRSQQGTSSSRSQQTTHYEKLLGRLRSNADMSLGPAFLGQSTTNRASRDSVAGRTSPRFSVGMDDND